MPATFCLSERVFFQMKILMGRLCAYSQSDMIETLVTLWSALQNNIILTTELFENLKEFID